MTSRELHCMLTTTHIAFSRDTAYLHAQGHDDGCGTGCEHHIRAEAHARALTAADRRRFEQKYIAPRLAPRSLTSRPKKPTTPHDFEVHDYAQELAAQQAGIAPPRAARHRGARDRDGDDEEELDEAETHEEMLVRFHCSPGQLTIDYFVIV